MISLTPLIVQEIQLKMLFANMRITPVLFQLRNIWNGRDKFFFCFWNCHKRENWKSSNKLNKAVQSNEIPTKLVKEFGYLFSKYIATSNYTAWKVSKYRLFSGPYFPVFGLNTEIYSECRKIRTRKNSVFGYFLHSVRYIAPSLHLLVQC